MIERGAVEGKVFHRGAVTALAPEPHRDGVPGRLLSLVRKELVRPDRSQIPGDDAFRFRHLLIRDTAYESLPKAVRAELHERFAEWLDGHAGLFEQDEIVGYHLEQAARYRAELDPTIPGRRISQSVPRHGSPRRAALRSSATMSTRRATSSGAPSPCFPRATLAGRCSAISSRPRSRQRTARAQRRCLTSSTR